MRIGIAAALCALLPGMAAEAQVYSPRVLRQGQPDSSDLARLVQGIYAEAGARTAKDRAEAVWRFFLTDGRFVKPGFWYHIAGWAYEEPGGEVLDPLKLINSYGFGLCYQVAPLLAAAWKAGGFEDARVWFLTGHTVAEVFYDGRYHYYDSDMMGFNPVAGGRVASVRDIEDDGGIILGKMRGPREVGTALVSSPWYPADVRAGAMGGLAALFTSKGDNWLFPFERVPRGHAMDFVLRPGERMIRYLQPERDGLHYLPYQEDGGNWREFPREVAQYGIRTGDGPRSQKDDRRWASGRLEYDVPPSADAVQVVDVRSPYVILDAEFQFDVEAAVGGECRVETSADGGRSWVEAGTLRGPHMGAWATEPATLTRSEHGRRSAVGGIYGYSVRLTRTGDLRVRGARLITRFQLNPRTLPALWNGRNRILYDEGEAKLRQAVPWPAPERTANATRGAQDLWTPGGGKTGELTFRVSGDRPSAVHAGARFLDLSRGLAPDKFTAEVRRVAPLPATAPAASIAWSATAAGPYQNIWEYDPRLAWRDGDAIDRTLLWPEVDRRAETGGVREVWVRYRFRDLGLDSVRLAAESPASEGRSPLVITHAWTEDGVAKTFARRIAAGNPHAEYDVETASRARIENRAVIFECPRTR